MLELMMLKVELSTEGFCLLSVWGCPWGGVTFEVPDSCEQWVDGPDNGEFVELVRWE